MNKEIQAWIAARPPSVQALAAEFPLGSQFQIGPDRFYLLGYTESDMLIITPVNPWKDFDRATRARTFIHTDCVRRNFTKTEETEGGRVYQGDPPQSGGPEDVCGDRTTQAAATPPKDPEGGLPA